jgi:hypothetical protein
MIDDVQREVAVHLLANALRKRRNPSGGRSGAAAGLGNRRRSPNDEYLRGLIDMLNGLYGRALADELYRQALTLESTNSMH